MSLERFELIDNETIDNYIMKRVFIKIHHQQGSKLNDPDQKIEFIFGENNNYHETGNAYLQYDITVRNPAASLTDGSVIRLVNNAFAYCFKEGSLSTTGNSDLEHDKFVNNFSTNMRNLTSKDGDLSSSFKTAGEKVLDNNNVLKQLLLDNHNKEADKVKIKSQLLLEVFFWVL